MVLSVDPSAPASGASTTTTSLPRGSRPCTSQPGMASDRGLDLVELLGTSLDQDAGDLAAGRRHDALGGKRAAR